MTLIVGDSKKELLSGKSQSVRNNKTLSNGHQNLLMLLASGGQQTIKHHPFSSLRSSAFSKLFHLEILKWMRR